MNGTESELRPAYRTLNEPTRLLGLSVAGWAVLLATGGAGYGWLLVSPLPWRATFTLAVLVLGAPAALIVLREQTTITPVRVLAGVIGWRIRPAQLVPPSDERPVRRGGLRLDTPPPAAADQAGDGAVDELPWLEHEPSNGARS